MVNTNKHIIAGSLNRYLVFLRSKTALSETDSLSRGSFYSNKSFSLVSICHEK